VSLEVPGSAGKFLGASLEVSEAAGKVPKADFEQQYKFFSYFV
jgi:hypothetical protein